MKRFLLFTKLLLAGATATFAQSVGINITGSQPNASSILDVSSTTKGLLIPRMTAAQRTAIASPAKGLLVFQDDVVSSFFYYDGSAWAPISSAAATAYTAGTGIDITGTVLSAKNTTALWNAAQLQGKDISTASPLNGQVMTYSVATNNWMPTTPGSANLTGWSTTGNAAINPATNFIGTTDAQPFIGKVNGQQVFRFSSTKENTIVGYQAGQADPTGGEKNHYIGYQAGFFNTSFNNHFDGYQAGFKNTGGWSNQFIGYQAGYSNLSGTDNLFIGAQAGYSSIIQSGSHFIGNGAGFSNFSGTENHFNGFKSGLANTTGSSNHFEGNHAGYHNISGNNNHFVGYNAGYNNTTGINNFFEGYSAGLNNTTANNNYFSGNNAGKNNTTGMGNTFSGNGAGFQNITGDHNVFNGSLAGNANVSGSTNVAVGYAAGVNNVNGSGNVFIGFQAGYSETGSNRLYIANTQTNNPLLFGEFDNKILSINGDLKTYGTQYINSSIANEAGLTLLNNAGGLSIMKFIVYPDISYYWNLESESGPSGEFRFAHNGNSPVARIKANGNMVINGLLTQLSDRRLKKNIKPLQYSLEKLLKVGGYTYNWIDSTRSSDEQIGLIAQEVEAQFPQLVNTEKDGTKSVSYTNFVPILVESIKEQQTMMDELKKANSKQATTIEDLLKRIVALEKK